MCLPLAVLGGILAAGGTAAKFAGDSQASNARYNTFQAERSRQQALTSDQTARFQDSLDQVKGLTDPNAQAKAVGARESSLVSAIAPQPTAGAYLPGSSSAPAVVQTAADKASAGSAATSSALAHAIATMGGASDQALGVNTAIGRNSEKIGQLSSYKAGSAGVLDAEMRAASQKGSLLKGLGGFAQQIGLSALAGGAFKGFSMPGQMNAYGVAGSDGIV